MYGEFLLEESFHREMSQGNFGGNVPRPCSEETFQEINFFCGEISVGCPEFMFRSQCIMQNYKSLRVAVMTWTTTHTYTDGQKDGWTDSS